MAPVVEFGSRTPEDGLPYALPMSSAPESTCVSVTALGVVVRLDCEDGEVAHGVRTAWADALVLDGDAATSTLTVGWSSTSDVSGQDIAEVLHHLSPAVTTRAIAARAGELVMLHAAALADPATGAAAVLVAASGTGKTTATSILGHRFAYVTDETAAIGPDGVLVPHRKPLSIIRSAHVKDQVSPSSLGLLTTDKPAHLAALLVIDRAPDHAGEPEVVVLDTIDALALLAPQASSLGRLDKPLHRLVELIERVGGVRRVKYAEAATLEPILRDLLAPA